MRTITVTQPALLDGTLHLVEDGAAGGTFTFRGLLRRSAELVLGDQRLTFTTHGLLGRTVRAEASGRSVGEFRQTGVLGRGDAVVGGRSYRFKVTGVLARSFHWVDASGAEVLSLRIGGLLRTSGTIQVADAAVPDDVAALVGLGLVARSALESDSGGAAAASAG